MNDFAPLTATVSLSAAAQQQRPRPWGHPTRKAGAGPEVGVVGDTRGRT